MPNLTSLFVSHQDYLYHPFGHEQDSALADVSSIDVDTLIGEIEDDPDYIARIDPASTQHYDLLVDLAISHKPLVIIKMRSEHFKRNHLQSLIDKAPSAVYLAESYHPDEFERFFDVAMATTLISRKIGFAAPPNNTHSFMIKDDLITDDALRAGVMANPYFAYIPVQRGRPNIIRDLVAEGYWPDEKWIKKKPVKLTTALKCYLSTSTDPNLPYGPMIWYKELIMSFPAERVVKVMCDAGCPDRLDEFYSRDFIAPFTKGNSAYSRACIMADMGI